MRESQRKILAVLAIALLVSPACGNGNGNGGNDTEVDTAPDVEPDGDPVDVPTEEPVLESYTFIIVSPPDAEVPDLRRKSLDEVAPA